MAKQDTISTVVGLGLLGAIGYVSYTNWDALKVKLGITKPAGVGQKSTPKANATPQTGTTPGTSGVSGAGLGVPTPSPYTNPDLSLNVDAFKQRFLNNYKNSPNLITFADSSRRLPAGALGVM